jgi:hypothetical protein
MGTVVGTVVSAGTAVAMEGGTTLVHSKRITVRDTFLADHGARASIILRGGDCSYHNYMIYHEKGFF